MPGAKLSSFAARTEPYVYAVLRIVTGAFFFVHGAQKIFGLYSDHMPHVGSQIWVGGVIELVGGVLIAVGLFTRCAAFVSSGQMAVAYIQFHWQLAFADGKWLPAVNHGELAAVYCFVFLYVAARGAGVWSVDARRK
jgi:putative oxidoreductase